MGGAVRRPPDLRPGHAAQLRADAVRAQAAGDLFASWASAARPARWSPRSRRDVAVEPPRGFSAARARGRSCRSRSRSRCGRRMYNGIRHFVFVLPPLAVLGGLAGVCSRRCRPARAGALRRSRSPPSSRVGIAFPVADDGAAAPLRVHPLQLARRRRRAARATATCSTTGVSPSSRPRRHCWRSSPSGSETKPGDRRWKIAVCGPHRSPQVELGPDFETTWDPEGRRLRDDARRILLRQARRAAAGRDRARRRRLCPRLRHPRTVDSDPADPARPEALRRRTATIRASTTEACHAPRLRLRRLWDAVRRACRHRPPPRRSRPRCRPLFRDLAGQAARIYLDADARRTLSSISGR